MMVSTRGVALAALCCVSWVATGCGGNAKTDAPSNAGSGGGDATAGAAGEPSGDAGQGGDSNPDEGAACQSEGNGIAVELDDQYTPVCRGMEHTISLRAGGLSDPAFTCCASLEASPHRAFAMSAHLAEDLSGRLTFTVPADAPLGVQALSFSCGQGGAFDSHLEVYERPALYSVTKELHAADEMHISGLHLSRAAFVALPLDGSVVVPWCIPKVTQAAPDDTEASCWFDEIAPGDYTLRVDTGGCSAATQLPFKVLP